MESMQSAESMKSMESAKSMQSADYASAVTEEEANAGMGMMENMPLDGRMPIDPKRAEEYLAQRVTEDTGAGGDPHAHNESKADELSKQMTEDTGAAGDMTLHAERKVDQMGREMAED